MHLKLYWQNILWSVMGLTGACCNWPKPAQCLSTTAAFLLPTCTYSKDSFAHLKACIVTDKAKLRNLDDLLILTHRIGVWYLSAGGKEVEKDYCIVLVYTGFFENYRRYTENKRKIMQWLCRPLFLLYMPLDISLVLGCGE